MESVKEAFPTLLGNRRLANRLAGDILGGRLSHAYLIEGKKGLGKHTLVRQIAAALACEKKAVDGVPLPCGECPACKKILSGNSPDLIFLNRGEKATISVESIRIMHGDVCVAPNEFDDKIYVIEDAHLMTPQAQNAFLLTLEEPPAYVRFFLLCDSVAPLLETVRSRAQTFRLETIPEKDLADHLCRHHREAEEFRKTSPEEFREMLIASGGSIGVAEELSDPKKRKPILEQRALARKFVSLCLTPHNSPEVLPFLSGLGQKREEILEQMGVLLLCLRDLFLCKQSENAPLCFFSDREEAHDLAYRFSSPELLKLCDVVNDLCERLRQNANIRLSLVSFAVRCGLLSE